jgi:biotin carboxyl carrier protein
MPRFHVKVDGEEYDVDLAEGSPPSISGLGQPATVQTVGDHLYSVMIGNQSFTVLAARSNGSFEVLCGGMYHQVAVDTERGRLLRKYATAGGDKSRHAEIHAPMPAMVVKVEVAVGDEVVEGQGLVILEAMKMENEIKSHQAGKVKSVLVEKGKAVEKGELLILLE